MDEIKAIETTYKGYRFRSRLEARWAVFFDTVGIKYEYETEGFTNGQDCYLPDFYLPDEDMYVEVKPFRRGAPEEIEKATRLLGDKIKSLIILPDIPDGEDQVWFFPVLFRHPVTELIDYKFVPITYLPVIDEVGIDRQWFEPIPEDDDEHLLLYFFDKDPRVRHEIVSYLLTPKFITLDEAKMLYGWEEQPRIDVSIAYRTARSARFER